MNHSFSTIQQLRKFYYMSQRDLGAIVGISERTYRDKEKGKYPFNQKEINIISKLFNLTATAVTSLFYYKYETITSDKLLFLKNKFNINS